MFEICIIIKYLLCLVLGSLGPSTVTFMAFVYVATWLTGCVLMLILILKDFPRPLLPTNLRSLNLATWFLITAVQFLSSAQEFSSFPVMRKIL